MEDIGNKPGKVGFGDALFHDIKPIVKFMVACEEHEYRREARLAKRLLPKEQFVQKWT